MENNIKRRGMKEIRAYAKQRPKVFTVYVILRLLVVAVLVRSAMLKEYESMFVCLLVLVLFMLPSFLERKLKIELPDTLEIIILVFIFAAEILGELECYFIQYPNWDTILHTTSGFLCAAIATIFACVAPGTNFIMASSLAISFFMTASALPHHWSSP